MKSTTLFISIAAVSIASAQNKFVPTSLPPKGAADLGVNARLKDIARFRGVRSNQLVGTGLIMGLDGTGDTKNMGPTAAALANYLRRQNMDVDPKTLQAKNVALVMVTAELPPFATNGQKLDVTVTSIGDAKSLRNGTLLVTELKSPSDNATVYAVAAGPVSVGGFGVSAGGNNQSKGFLTVGRIPGGANVEKNVETNVLHDGNKMFIELDDPDATTAQRTQNRINRESPAYKAVALNGGTIEVTIPTGMTPTEAMARLEEISVPTDQAALIIVNEKTGTIVMGGNIKIAPVAFMYGSLSIKVEEDNFVSQPAPLSGGVTTLQKNQNVTAKDDGVKGAVTTPNTTVADLAAIFQKLNLGAGDVIAILQGLRQQGALKARVVLQ